MPPSRPAPPAPEQSQRELSPAVGPVPAVPSGETETDPPAALLRAGSAKERKHERSLRRSMLRAQNQDFRGLIGPAAANPPDVVAAEPKPEPRFNVGQSVHHYWAPWFAATKSKEARNKKIHKQAAGKQTNETTNILVYIHIYIYICIYQGNPEFDCQEESSGLVRAAML